MNKYKKTLNYLRYRASESEFMIGVEKQNDSSYAILQELVDKATPYQVDKYQMTNFGAVGNCKCGKKVNDIQRYCMHCGQALDWSEE